MRLAFAFIAFACLGGLIAQEKVRPKPSAATLAVGSFVHWESDLAAAQKKSAASARPIFWYLSTTRGSPMDRKAEVDLAVRAGPFSEPQIVKILNERFIPLRGAPSREEAESFEILPQRFIEPGFLILDQKGELLARTDEITTLSEAWFLHRLASALGEEPAALSAKAMEGSKPSDRATTLRAHLSAGQAAEALSDPGAIEASDHEARFLRGAALWFAGRQEEAKEAFAALAGPLDVWTTRAAAESQGFGPITRGLYTFRAVPAARLVPSAARGTNFPRPAKDLAALRIEALDVLLDLQAKNGGWTDSIYDFGGTASLPNVYLAVTALCALAIDRHLRDPATATSLGSKRVARLGDALSRAEAFLLDETKLAPADKNEIAWAHLYRLHHFAERLGHLEGEPAKALQAGIQRVAKALFDQQLSDGSFRHEYPNPFVTAAAVQALKLAEGRGVALPQKLFVEAAAYLERCRAEDGTFSYGTPRRGKGGANRLGAAGRMPVCELGLLLAGGSDQSRLKAAIEVAAAEEPVLAKVRKYDNHADRYGNGGFFYWFDLFHRREAIMALKDEGDRNALLQGLKERVLQLPEFDGSFVDSHELGRAYGTAMGLLVLAP